MHKITIKFNVLYRFLTIVCIRWTCGRSYELFPCHSRICACSLKVKSVRNLVLHFWIAYLYSSFCGRIIANRILLYCNKWWMLFYLLCCFLYIERLIARWKWILIRFHRRINFAGHRNLCIYKLGWFDCIHQRINWI